MPKFDAERYLRQLGERQLLRSQDHFSGWIISLTSAAEALLAAGVIGRRRVQAVLDDYTLAMQVREGDGYYEIEPARTRRNKATQPFESRRVVACDRAFDHPLGRIAVRSVALGREDVTLTATVQLTGARRHAYSAQPPTVTLVDDRGTTTTAHFSGSGSSDEWVGTFTGAALAPDTAFVEIDGVRVELTAVTAPVEIRIEALPETDPVIGYLSKLAEPDQYSVHAVALEPAIDALIAAGRVEPDDPRLRELRAVAELAMGHGQPRNLPEPWRSLRSAIGGGPEGSIVLSATTPIFDGCAVAVDLLESQEGGWTATVRVAPGEAMLSMDGLGDVARRLSWWATDDRGHHYFGRLDGWHGYSDSGTGGVQFPALDPKASWVELMPTAQTHRAVIRVPLEWS